MARIDHIRAQYPHPVPCPTDSNTDIAGLYCVGGALSLSQVGGTHLLAINFPTPEVLALVLLGANTHLDEGTARKFATVITTLNDADHTDVAWMAAELALAY